MVMEAVIDTYPPPGRAPLTLSSSEMILRILVFPFCLLRVAAVAKRLPVALIPEEFRITTVRDDMIDVRCLHVPSFLHALHTQRMHLKILLPGFLPRTAVASARSRPYLFWMHRLVSVAILLS